MSDAASENVTLLLSRYADGDAAAGDALVRAMAPELRAAASRAMRGARADHTLQPTALVNEAWLKLAGGHGPIARDRVHLLALAASAMRSVLVDHARRRAAQKRPSANARVALEAADSGRIDPAQTLVQIDDELSQLARVDADLARIVELRFFGGLSIDETAAALAVSTPTVERGWRTARAWLETRLAP